MDENENDEVEKPEDADRYRKMKDKIDKFMIDVSGDMLDESTLKAAENKITRTLKMHGIPANASYVKAFSEGFQMCMAIGSDAGLMIPALASIQAFVGKLDRRMKTQVDKSIKETLI